MIIYFATRVRGFFKNLFNSKDLDYLIEYDKNNIYELNSWKTKLKNLIGRSFLFDKLGFIQVIKPKKSDYDIYGSFNRFLDVKKPYFIYVENPTALYHYKINRRNSFLGKRNINKELQNPNLKALLFMSNACGSTFRKVCGKPHEECLEKVIYPYIPNNSYINEKIIHRKSKEKTLKLLFIAQGLRFKSKGGLEVITAYRTLKNEGLDLHLTLITSINDLEKKFLDSIKENNDIELYDFKFSFEELQKIYLKTHILLITTSDDSFNLTVLEAIKSGLPVIGSKLYAIPEMVKDGYNGFLCNPHWWFFDENNFPNPKVWDNRNKTIYSGKISREIVNFLIDKIKLLYMDRTLLLNLSKNSLYKSSSPPFSSDFIISQWNDVLSEIESTITN